MSATPRLFNLSTVFAVLVLLVAACLPGGGDLGTVAPPPGSPEPSIDVPSPEPTPGPLTLRAYFVLGSFTGDEGLVPVLRTVPHTRQVGAAAMARLLAGPVDAELAARPAMYTAIPDGTRFLGLSIADEIATVNLSREFAAGGTTATIVQRYAQVVYTLTQFPTVESVRFQLDGEDVPAPMVGGSGVLDRAVTRDDYLYELPSIAVDHPAWGGALPSGGNVSGMANVFEAQGRLMVLDQGGRALTDMPFMATCGTGCWGAFDVSVTYTVSDAQWGTLRVYEPSAKDGSPIHVVDYPVWLTP